MAVADDLGPRRRGPRPRFTMDEVLDAAERLPPSELTMVALSESLGMTGSAIYRYVRDKDHLLELLTERLSHALPMPDAALAWDAWIRETTHGVYALFVAHPLLYDTQTWTLLGGRGRELVVRAQDVLQRAGFSPKQSDDLYTGATQLAFGLAWGVGRADEPIEEARVRVRLDGSLDLLIAGARTLL